MSDDYLKKFKAIREKYGLIEEKSNSILKSCNNCQKFQTIQYALEKVKKSHSLMKRPQHTQKLDIYNQHLKQPLFKNSQNYEDENRQSFHFFHHPNSSKELKSREEKSFINNKQANALPNYEDSVLSRPKRTFSLSKNIPKIQGLETTTNYLYKTHLPKGSFKTPNFGQNSLKISRRINQGWTIDNLSKVQNKIQAYLRR